MQLNVPKSLSESVVILKLADLFPCATSCPLLMLTILTRGVGYPENTQATVTSFWWPIKEYTGVGDNHVLIFGGAKCKNSSLSED